MSMSKEEREAAQVRFVDKFGMVGRFEIFSAVPDEILRDVILNLSRTLDGETTLFARADRLLMGFAIAVCKGESKLAHWLKDASKLAGKTEEDCEAARAVTLTCMAYNGYYKFRSLLQNEIFESFLPALRASPFVKSILSKQQVELICIAVSTLEGCGYCVKGHVKSAQDAGATPALIDEIVRLGAVVGALATFEQTDRSSNEN